MAFRTLVVGTDFSAEAERALQHALHIARLAAGDVTLVHAGTLIDVPSARHELREAAQAGLYEEYLGEVRGKLAAARASAERHGVVARERLVDGFADTAVPRAARELGADLVAVGSHGRTGIRRLFLGSVAERIVRVAGMSVLVARQPLPHPGYHRVLVPVDFSRASELALASATLLAAPGAFVEAVHYWQPPPAFRYAPACRDIPAVAERLAASSRYAAGRAGEELVERHRRRDLELTFRAARGNAITGIVERAAEGFDLVVLGRGGRQGLRRVLLGSMVDTVARKARCSVLIVK